MHRAEPLTKRIIRDQLEVIFFKLLKKQRPQDEEEALKITAVMLSWGMYGASVEWKRSSKEPEEFIILTIPLILSGIR